MCNEVVLSSLSLQNLPVAPEKPSRSVTDAFGDLPFGDLPGPLALLSHVVEDLSQFAAAPPGRDAVDAHVEVLAVLGVGVTGVGQALGLVHLRAVELEHLWKEAGADLDLDSYVKPELGALKSKIRKPRRFGVVTSDEERGANLSQHVQKLSPRDKNESTICCPRC